MFGSCAKQKVSYQICSPIKCLHESFLAHTFFCLRVCVCVHCLNLQLSESCAAGMKYLCGNKCLQIHCTSLLSRLSPGCSTLAAGQEFQGWRVIKRCNQVGGSPPGSNNITDGWTTHTHKGTQICACGPSSRVCLEGAGCSMQPKEGLFLGKQR